LGWNLGDGRTSHKKMCPLLKEWRLLGKGRGCRADFDSKLVEFFRGICFKKEEKMISEDEEEEEESGGDEEENEIMVEDKMAKVHINDSTFKEASAHDLQSRKIVKATRMRAVAHVQVSEIDAESGAGIEPPKQVREPELQKVKKHSTQSTSTQYQNIAAAAAPAAVAPAAVAPAAVAPAAVAPADVAPAARAAFQPGDVVTVVGLQARAQHNGKVGKVTGRQRERFQVQLQDDEMTTMALKPANLEPEFLAEGSLPFYTFVKDLEAMCADNMEEGLGGRASNATADEKVLSKEVQGLRLARLLSDPVPEQAKRLTQNFETLGMPVMIGRAYSQSLGTYISSSAETASRSTGIYIAPPGSNLCGTAVKFEDAVAFTRILATQIYKKIAFALLEYPPGIGQKDRSLKIMEKVLLISEKVSKDMVADTLLTVVGLKFGLKDYSGGLALISRHRIDFSQIADSDMRTEILSKLALTCLHNAERATEESVNGILGDVSILLKLFETGAELAAESNSASTRYVYMFLYVP